MDACEDQVSNAAWPLTEPSSYRLGSSNSSSDSAAAGNKNRSSSSCLANSDSGNNNNNELAGSNSCLTGKSSNNSNSKRNNSSNKSSSTYSKLFRQYLPHSLVGGSKNSSASSQHQRPQDSCKVAVQAGELQESEKIKQLVDTGNESFVVDEANLHQHFQSSASISSTFCKLKLTSSAGDKEQGREDQRASVLAKVSKSSSSRFNKRRGFLYLKKKCQQPNSVAETTNLETSNQKLSHKVSNKRRDLNNNCSSSFSNLLHSNNQNKQDDEHTTCLLDEEDECEEYSYKLIDRETMFNQQPPITFDNNEASNKSKSKSKNKMKGNSGSSNYVIATLLISGLVAAFSRTIFVVGQQSSSMNQPPFSRSQTAPGGIPPASGATSGGRAPPLQTAAGSLVANINCNKIRGHVTLTPNAQVGQGGALTTVSTQISAGPPGEVYQWSVHQFPVKPGAAMCSCSPMILGTKLLDLSEMHGNLPSDQEFSVQSSLNLFGSDSLVGHSLMLRGMKTGMVACATFLPTSRKSNYRAKFHTPISGSVTIFQTAFGTSFISHLMYSNGTRRHSTHRFDLVKSEDDIVATSLMSGAQVGGGGGSTGASSNILPLSAATRAETLALEQREHEHELSQCRRFAAGEPLLRNMSYQLTVSTENFGMRGRTSMVLPQIPFETFGSVFVVIYSELEPSEPLACAPLKFVKPKTAAAKFQSVSVQGSVVFSQDSPYDPTIARVNLNLPNSDGHSYGIDELPMIIRRKSDTRVCPNIREIIYNPHHVEPSSVPPEGEATSDQYAVGDLSGKYGSLTGKATEKVTMNDFNLPLYGPISIVGRAMTVYSAEGVAIACSNVELTTPMTTAFATFDYGIQGQFIFRQPVNDCNGDTYVYIEVSKPTSAGSGSGPAQVSGSQPLLSAASTLHNLHGDHNSRSLDHNWHIHTNPVDSGLDHLSTTDCSPAGPHFNPYNTSTSSIYSRDCTPFNVLRCELGDLSAKMFTIEIPPYRVKNGQEPDIGKFFGTDIDLPLCGPVSIVNRSVVVHVQDFGAQRLACSTVIEFKPRAS